MTLGGNSKAMFKYPMMIGRILAACCFAVAFNTHAAWTLPAGVSSFETTMEWDGRTRDITYLRPTASSLGKVPLLVVLHYKGGTPERMDQLTAMSQLVADTGIWVAIPAGISQEWSIDPSRRTYIDDSGFISQLITDSLSGNSDALDPKRVYMTGFSQGGYMVERFVCEHGNQLAAAAWVSSELINKVRYECGTQIPLPVLGINGTADRRVPYDGQYGVNSAPAGMAYFAGLNGCSLPPDGTDLPDTVDDGTTVHLDKYSNCSSGKPVWFYTINGGGHTWPGSTKNPAFLGTVSYDIDGTQTLWNFLRWFALP
jgi:polyhydroxybutyrate depolymerase